jgi:hypothetical protein
MRSAVRTIKNPDLYRTALGKTWFYDPLTLREVLSATCPEGFNPGRPSMVSENPGKDPSEKTKERMSQSQKRIPSESRYWFGKRGNASGTSWWYNPETGENKRSKTQPGHTWIKGRK